MMICFSKPLTPVSRPDCFNASTIRPLQNHSFVRVIKKHAKLSENIGPDMSCHSLPCRRSLLEKVRCRPLHNHFPDLQLRQPNFTRPLLASNSLTRASLPRVDFRFQAGSLHKIMRQTERSIATRVD